MRSRRRRSIVSGGDAMTTSAVLEREASQLDDDACWRAVAERRQSARALFVVAVRTTRIYCRPGCPARAARRPDLVLVCEVCRALDAAGDAPPTLAELGARFGKSPFHLQRTFKQITGVSPRQYAAARRLQRARSSL